MSLNMAGLAVKLLKGHEVQLSHTGVLMTEELVLPSLSGVPIKLDVNMTSLLSMHLKGSFNYRDTSHFSLNGYIRPNAYVDLSARMGVNGALGQAAVEWLAELKSSPRSKMIGWQLCSNVSYASLASGITFPPTGPIHLSLRLLKLDKGLYYYLLEAAYSLHYKRGTWLPREASFHLLLATPQSSIPRDMSLDLAFSSHRVLLRIKHPLKAILLQGQAQRKSETSKGFLRCLVFKNVFFLSLGQFVQERTIKSGKLELVIDSVYYHIMVSIRWEDRGCILKMYLSEFLCVHFNLQGMVDSTSFQSEQRTRYHLEAKTAADEHPMILSANVTRGLGRKSSFSATLKNIFRETASLSGDTLLFLLLPP
ncbi:hypothetical protein XENOCAPTIV_018800 [Xenoophorus captivus]|uniref:Vitellinogen open beta-sheet domain-containing protein n=1 Tax=Xenoophorus captivus TaxID=1517983 RepID=A0ABV0Q4P5_9TELE